MALITAMATALWVALNPVRRFAQARNTHRQTEAKSIADAVLTYKLDEGNYPTGIDNTWRMLGTAGSGCQMVCVVGEGQTADACLDLSSALTTKYLPSMPADPTEGSGARTYYAIKEGSKGQIRVAACAPELGEEIVVEQ